MPPATLSAIYRQHGALTAATAAALTAAARPVYVARGTELARSGRRAGTAYLVVEGGSTRLYGLVEGRAVWRP